MDDNFEDLPKVDHSEVTIPPLLPILDKREHVECKISIKCALSTIAPLIVKELSKNAGELEWFRKKSPFGHLLDVPSHYQHSSQMMWLLLLRQVKCERRNEMWFVVNGKPIRFSLLEYVLISGLSGSEYPVGYAQQSRSLNFRKRHFPKNTIVSIDDVQAKFLEMSRKNQGEVFNMEKLKMAMLLFASAVLYYGNKFSTGIEHFLLGLVDDIDMFIQFPWGKDSFNFLRKQLVKSLKGKAGKKSSTMSYGGFVFPLAILVYECIPSAFAKPRENLESEIPRICRWQMTWKLRQSPSYDEILKTLGQSQNISGLLTPTDEELQMPYMLLVKYMKKKKKMMSLMLYLMN